MTFADVLDILYEDNHLIAVNKPAGWPSAHFNGRDETMDRVVKAYLKEKYSKPGNVFLGVVHRLDKPVTGVLLFARTSKSAARLSEQFRENLVEKTYWAVTEGAMTAPPLPLSGTLEDYLRKRPDGECVETVSADTPDARHAVLYYTQKGVDGPLGWFEIRPQTGRTHQIRVQLAQRGRPVYGDLKYGAKCVFGPGIGLHAQSITILHPVTKELITLSADIPRSWRGRFARLFAKSA